MDNEEFDIGKKTFIKGGSMIVGGLIGATALPALAFGLTGMAAVATLAYATGAVGGAAGGWAVGNVTYKKLNNSDTETKKLEAKNKKQITQKED